MLSDNCQRYARRVFESISPHPQKPSHLQSSTKAADPGDLAPIFPHVKRVRRAEIARVSLLVRVPSLSKSNMWKKASDPPFQFRPEKQEDVFLQREKISNFLGWKSGSKKSWRY